MTIRCLDPWGYLRTERGSPAEIPESGTCDLEFRQAPRPSDCTLRILTHWGPSKCRIPETPQRGPRALSRRFRTLLRRYLDPQTVRTGTKGLQSFRL